MVRGKTYTFVVEGGDDKEFPAGYHPFYITDDPEGGYEFKSERERRRSRVTLYHTDCYLSYQTGPLKVRGVTDPIRAHVI